VRIELINIGTELMLGRAVNTHHAWLGRRLADDGRIVDRQVAVADDAPSIREAVLEGLRRAELVITTGGLGPTSDDLTRDLVAELLGRPLVEDASTRARIEAYFASRGRTMPLRVLTQARVPQGARVLPNRHGTAPGLAMQVAPGSFAAHGSWIILLPGPPRELHPMFEEEVRPLLRAEFAAPHPFYCVTLHTCGMGESWVEERLTPVLPRLVARGLEVGYCARTGEVDIRLSSSGSAAAVLVEEAEAAVRHCVGEHIYGSGDDSLESIVIRLAANRQSRIALAESCTGGYVAHRLTNVPGASEVFWGGWVTYDNSAKERELGVPPGILAEYGAVSAECARAMAEGALARSASEHALAITGIAGPAGGTAEKPVGTVHIALASKNAATCARRFFNPYDRETFKYVTSQQALDMLRRRLLGREGREPVG
jgi:nicotinamide-nucleotide amidase